jgi:xylitol oxidase
MTTPLTNWAGNVTFGAARVHRPTSVRQVQDIVGESRRARALGTGHSFNQIADTTGDLVSVADLPQVMDIDSARSTVSVSAGIRYGELVGHLYRAGYALHNLGSLPHISIAGACATGTHGSGETNGNLSTAVAGLNLVTAAGDVVSLTRSDDDFAGAVVALGALGVVTGLTLDVQPTFDVAQYVYDGLPFEQALRNLDEIEGTAYSVSLFTDWKGAGFNQVWRKHRLDHESVPTPPGRWFGATLADGPRHPVPGMQVENCTEQLGVPGPWQDRLPHFRLEFTPSSGDELQSEFLVDRVDAVAALTALDGIRERIAPVLQISEIRTVAADDLWLSPSYRRESVALHFTWIGDGEAVTPVLALVEERLAEFAPRPHWGKLFDTPPELLGGRYERWADFAALTARYDPANTFGNTLLDRCFSPRG